MRNGRRIVDAHIHSFPYIDGISTRGKTQGTKNGRMLVNGVEESFIPEWLADSAFPIELALNYMDKEGVDQAFIIQNSVIGDCNEYISEAVARYPKRFFASVQVDPFSKDAASTLEHYASLSRPNVFKMEISEQYGWSGMHRGLRGFDSPGMSDLWDIALKYKMAVMFDTGLIGTNGYQTEQFAKLADAYPSLPIIIEHGCMCKNDFDTDSELRPQWDAMAELGRKENIYMGLTAIVETAGNMERAMWVLEHLLNIAGERKIVWGSDIPGNMRFWTYNNMIEWAEKAPCLTERQKDLFLAQNMLDMFK